jgi:CheY-like chemotaxis protein
VELHDGSIAAFSDGPGCGSEFVVELPLAREGVQQASSANQATRPSETIRVLLIDDDALLAELTGELIASFGAAVKVVHSGPEALAAIPQFEPQLVFVDIGMPGMDGYETARRIRLRDGNPSRRVVALSGWGQPEDIRRGAEAGFDAHFVKPIKEADLKSLLDSFP